jgi:hypothetical protein
VASINGIRDEFVSSLKGAELEVTIEADGFDAEQHPGMTP